MLNNKISLFPLDLVLFPKEELTLHIFEERYKSMISDCLIKNKHFGVILKQDKHIYKVGYAYTTLLKDM